MPLIVFAPGFMTPGLICAVPVVSTDLFPRFLNLARVPLLPDLHQDGVSFAPLLKGAPSLSRETLYWHYPHYHGSTWAPGGAICHEDWKMIEFFTEDNVELYNLKDDLRNETISQPNNRTN